MPIRWHKIAYRRVCGRVTMYPSQKKKGHLLLLKRGNISVKGDPKEKISQVTILLMKEHYHFKQYNKNKNYCNLYEIYINCMLCYHFSRNIPSDMPIHTSLYTGSCLVTVHSLHCSIQLSKYYTHVCHIYNLSHHQCVIFFIKSFPTISLLTIH